jgi:hypothetical protein
MNIIQAFKQLRKGNKIRVINWIETAYLFLDETGVVRNGWLGSNHTEIRSLSIEDIEFEWEILNEKKKEMKE